MKDNKAIIAKNPLSENIAKILNYKEGMLESELRKEAKIISDKIKDRFKKSVSPETITSWTLADRKDPVKGRIFIGFDRISMFSEIVGINYWELFIPSNFLNINNLSLKRKDTIEMVLAVDEKFLIDIQHLIESKSREDAARVLKLATKFSDIIKKVDDSDNQ